MSDISPWGREVPSVAPAPTDAKLTFAGENGDFRRLVTKGALLELITFGFYRFWLATNMRRHLWTKTRLENDPFEYTGNGRELFVGFVFALAILAPIYLGYFLLGLEVERQQSFASLGLALLLFAFGQFAAYRARRYRLTRTLWRGVRFWMTGSGWKYAFKAVLWDFLTFLTLGLALPWRTAALERYKMQHTHYGSLQGGFTGTGGQFFKVAWGWWALCFIIVFAFMAVVALPIYFYGNGKISYSMQQNLGPITFVLFLWPLAVPFIYGGYKAAEWRWWVKGITFGDVSADSNLASKTYYGNIWKFIGLSIPVFAIYGFIVSMIIKVIVDHPQWRDQLIHQTSVNGQLQMQVSVLINIAFYLIFMLMFGIILRIYLQQRIWKMVVNSITLHNTAALNNVAAGGDAANAIGEGFADSLDIVGF